MVNSHHIESNVSLLNCFDYIIEGKKYWWVDLYHHFHPTLIGGDALLHVQV